MYTSINEKKPPRMRVFSHLLKGGRSHSNKRVKKRTSCVWPNSVRLYLSYIKEQVFFLYSLACFKVLNEFSVIQLNMVEISSSRTFHVGSIIHEITSKTMCQQEKHFNRRGHGKGSDCLVFSVFLAVNEQAKRPLTAHMI